LGLPKPKPTPYNLRMANQTTTKLMGLIKDLKIYVCGIFYITMITILQNNVVDSSYSILLGRPWLRDAKVAHDWGSNIVTIQGNGFRTIQTITVTKHLGSEVKRPKVLLCHIYQNGIIDEEKIIIFLTEAKLFSKGTINLLQTVQSMKNTCVGIMDTNVKTSISEHGFEIHNTYKKIHGNRYGLEVALEDKVYP
jgi:hypothetical protein